MIVIQDKKDCCGCGACMQICPRQCISMEEDEEGFLYPLVDNSSCINCHLCEKVCPVVNQNQPGLPLDAYAAKNPDDKIRINSSSGGIFTMLAEKIIDDGGVVFGAKFNDKWEVVHDFTETKSGLAEFRGSKYLQSRIGNTFKSTRDFLKEGRQVLYSGTPCQIAGLKHYLRKEYDNLLTVDIICHGVPSPGVWRFYLNNEADRQKKSIMDIKQILFRDKVLGWKNFSFTIDFISNDSETLFSEPLNVNHFMKGFLKNLYLRPSCYACPAKKLRSGADITLGDYWGINQVMSHYDDDKGVSAVLVNSEKGVNIFKTLELDCNDSAYEVILNYNPALEKSPVCPKNRYLFYKQYKKDFYKTISKLTRVPVRHYLKLKLYIIAGMLFPQSFKRLVKKLIKR